MDKLDNTLLRELHNDLAILRLARSYLSDMGWCQEAAARNAMGNTTDPVSETAVAFCASGACHLASYRLNIPFFGAAYMLGLTDVVHWNDDRRREKQEVLDLFEKQIGFYEKRIEDCVKAENNT